MRDPANASRKLLSRAIALRSMTPRSLDGAGSSSTSSHRNGISPTYLLACNSKSASATLRSVRASPSRLAAVPVSLPTPQDAGREVTPWRASATPTRRRKIDPRWLPFPRCVPRCCDSLPHNVLRLPPVSAWVPMRTTRRPSPDPDRNSPGSKKKYSPRRGQSMRPVHSTSRRVPRALASSRSSS